VGVPALLWLIHIGGLSFSIFVVVIAVLCLQEYAMILTLGGRAVQRINTVAVGAALAACVALGGPVGLLLTAAVALLMLREMVNRAHSLDRVALTLFGALFLGWMPAHLALIRDLRPDGRALCFLFFAAVWSMDTAAYAVGSSFGRHKLAEALSPKKTWEGAAAGFGAAIAVSLLFRSFFLRESLSAPQAVVLGALIGVFGQVSDLAESLIKRAVGAKESGSLLPGHGGVMDRFDAFILCAPAVYYFLTLTKAAG
jgi:phosphatidate cytidylyltransferase